MRATAAIHHKDPINYSGTLAGYTTLLFDKRIPPLRDKSLMIHIKFLFSFSTYGVSNWIVLYLTAFYRFCRAQFKNSQI